MPPAAIGELGVAPVSLGALSGDCTPLGRTMRRVTLVPKIFRGGEMVASAPDVFAVVEIAG